MCVSLSVDAALRICCSLTGLVVTVDHAWETSYIYLTTIRNINGMVYVINTNNTLNVRVHRNNASNASNKLFTKKLL